MDINDIRRMYPDTAGRTDTEIVQALAQRAGMSPDSMANYLGYKEDKNFASDTAIDLTKGVVGIGQGVVGLANLASGGAAGQMIRAHFGGDLGTVQDKLSRMYSSKRLEANQNVDNAQGFAGTAKALVQNPRALVGSAIESAPSMAIPIGLGGKAASMAVRGAEAASPALERAAIDKLGQVAANRAQTAGWAGMTAGQTAEKIERESPGDTAAMYEGALGAGAAVGAITHGFSFLPGGHMADQAAGTAARYGQSVLNQSGMMAGMGAASTLAENAATGHDLDRGLPEAIAAGAVSGAAFGLMSGRRRADLLGGNPEQSVAPGSDTLPTSEIARAAAPDAAPAEPQPSAPIYVNSRGEAMTGAELPAYQQFGDPQQYEKMMQEATLPRTQLDPAAEALAASQQRTGQTGTSDKTPPPTPEELQQVYAVYGAPKEVAHTDGQHVIAGADGNPVMVTHFNNSHLPVGDKEPRGPYLGLHDPDLHKDIQKLVDADREKSAGQRAAEVVAADAVREVMNRDPHQNEIKLLMKAAKIDMAQDPEHMRIALQQKLNRTGTSTKAATERDLITAMLKQLPESKKLEKGAEAKPEPAPATEPQAAAGSTPADTGGGSRSAPVPNTMGKLADAAGTQGQQVITYTDHNGKARTLTKQAYMAKLAGFKGKDLARLQRLTGMDAEGYLVNPPMTHAQAAEAEGVTTSAISNWAKDHNITEEVVSRIAATPPEPLPAGAEAEFLHVRGGEDEAVNPGFHVADNVSELHKAGLMDEGRTAMQMARDKTADRLLEKSKREQVAKSPEEIARDKAFEEKRIAQAKADFESMVKLAEHSPRALREAGQIFENLRKGDESLPSFERLSKEDKTRWMMYAASNEEIKFAGGDDNIHGLFNEFKEYLNERNSKYATGDRSQGESRPGDGEALRSGAGAAGEAPDVVVGKPSADVPVAKRKRRVAAPDAQASTDERTGGNYTAASLSSDLQKFMGTATLGKRVLVVDTATDLPRGFRELAEDSPASVAWTMDGRAALIADRISAGNGRAVFMHEVGAHLGIDKLLPAKQHEALAEQVRTWAKEGTGVEGEIARAVEKRVDFAQPPEGHLNAETIAYFVEEAVRRGVAPTAREYNTPLGRFFQTVMAAFKRALSHVMGDTSRLSATDIVDLAYGAARQHIETNSEAPARAEAYASVAAPAEPERRSIVKRNIRRLPPALRPAATKLSAAIHEGTLRAGMASAFLPDLADWAGKHGMPAMKKISDVMARKGAMKYALDQDLGKVVRHFQHLPDDAQSKVQKFLLDSTTSQKWGYKPEWRSDVQVAPEMEKRYSELTPQEKAVVDAVLKHGNDMWDKTTAAIAERTLALKQESVAHAVKNGAQQAEIDALWHEVEQEVSKVPKRLDGPYVPLTRFGSHAVTMKSNELLRAKDEDPDAYRNMLRDPEHYRIEFADGAGEAELRREKLAEEHPDATVEASRREDTQYLGASYDALEKLASQVKAAPDGESEADAKLARATYRALHEAIVQSLGEFHARSTQLHRRNIAGVNPDEVMRGFASRGYASNRFLATVAHGAELQDGIQRLRQQKDTGGDRATKQLFYNELMARQAGAMNADTPRWISHAMRFTTLWKLVTSPAYYLQYLSQPITMFMPLVAGEHGGAAAWREMIHAVGDVKAIANGLHEVDLSQIKDANERHMLEDLRAHGTIEMGHEQSFGQLQTLPEKGFSKAWSKATDLATSIPRSVEMHNRIMSALAAYRLERTKGTDHETATAKARSLVHQAYGDYSAYAAPRIMGKGVMRLATQYRQFQLIHTALLARLLHNAFGGEHGDVRKAAKIQLAYMAGHYGVLAGGLGIPAAHVVAGALRAAFGDDEDKDNETFIKRHVNNQFVADMLIGGAPRAALGQDLGTRMGAGDILSPFRYTNVGDALKSKDAYKDMALAVAGPFLGSMVPQVIDGVNTIGQGDYYRGLEELMPKGIADVMKATRYAEEGVESKRGQTTLTPDELSTSDVLGTALGSRSSKISDAQRATKIVGDTMQEFKDEANTIKGQYVRARKAGEDAQPLVEKWKGLAMKMREAGIKPHTLGELYTAPAKQGGRDRQVIDGVPFQRTNKGLVQSVTADE